MTIRDHQERSDRKGQYTPMNNAKYVRAWDCYYICEVRMYVYIVCPLIDMYVSAHL